MSDKKKNKKKTIYVDDGRTIVDMSATYGTPYSNNSSPVKYSFREKLRTYFASVKLMLLPMLVTLGIIAAAFGILYLLLSLA
ncbi:MAG: hypothetical protein IJY23_01410 [Clostridia bacterium]|nr:hypothetical protein [Clostridia bacterium]